MYRHAAEGFDAVITLNGHHLAMPELSRPAAAAVDEVRRTVESMAGAGWIDVEAQSYPPELPGWVIVNPRGRCLAPDTQAWDDLQREVEAMAWPRLLVRVHPSKPSETHREGQERKCYASYA